MNPLRIFLLAALILVVFGSGKADAEKEPIWEALQLSAVDSVAMSADGEYIAVSTGDIALFHKDNNTPLWTATIGSDNSVSISSDGEYIAVGSRNWNLYLFHKDSSEPIWTYETGGDIMKDAIAMSSNGEYIIAGSEDSDIYLFHKDSNTPLWNYTVEDHCGISVAISADGNDITAGCGDTLYFFNKDSSTPLWTYISDVNNGVISIVDISEDGEYITFGDSKGHIHMFENGDNTPLWICSDSGSGGFGKIYSIAMSSDGDYIAVSSDSLGGLHFFGKVGESANSDCGNRPLWSYHLQFDALSVAISSDGEKIIAGTLNRELYSFNKKNNTPLWSYVLYDSVHSVDISADGKYLAVGIERYGLKLFLNNAMPVATIGSITPSLAQFGANVTFSGSGSDIDGTIIAYEWRSNISGFLSDSKYFNISELSIGEHTIHFKVQDSEGEWSEAKYGQLRIYATPVASANYVHWNDDTILKDKVTTGEKVNFQGVGNDEDGKIVLYEWDFNGDGEFDWSSGDNGITTFIYNIEGNYEAVLRVTDNDGFTDTDSRLITVSEEESALPSVSLITSIISIGLLAIFRRK